MTRPRQAAGRWLRERRAGRARTVCRQLAMLCCSSIGVGIMSGESVTAPDVSTYGTFSLSPVDETFVVGAFAATDESPFDHYQRGDFGSWPVDAADADDPVVSVMLRAPGGPVELRLRIMVDDRSFRAAAERVIKGERPSETLDESGSVAADSATPAEAKDPNEAGLSIDAASATPRITAQRYQRSSADERLRTFVASQDDPASIDREELNWLLNNWRPGPPMYVSTRRFSMSAGSEVSLWGRIDADRDGEISTVEIDQAVERIREADSDRDRVITVAELGQVSLIALRSANFGVLSEPQVSEPQDGEPQDGEPQDGVHQDSEPNPEAPVSIPIDVLVDSDGMTVECEAATVAKNGTLEIKIGQATLELLPVADRRTDMSLLARSQFSVAARPVGNPLFVACEQTRDGRLDESEQQQLRRRLTELDLDRDGRILPEEVPRRMRLVIAQGPWAAPVLEQLGRQPVATPGAETETPMTPAPDWFAGMDTNDDRFLSGREFLGERESFEQMDIDGDGLLSVEEAIAAAEE